MLTCKCGFTGNNPTHLRMCEVHQNWLNSVKLKITKGFLLNEYIELGKSAKAISKSLGLPNSRVVNAKLSEYNINRRTLQEAKKQKHHIELSKKTSLEKYGVEFHLQSDSPILKKAKKTILVRYGVEHISQNQGIKDKVKSTVLDRYGVEYISQNQEIKDKVKSTVLDRYGVDNVSKVQEFIDKGNKTKFDNYKSNPPYSMKSQNFFYKIYNKLPSELKEKTYFALLNKEYGKYDKVNKRYYYYDFVITGVDFCLEYNGNYYHANPEMYQEDFFNKHLNLTAKEIWEKDNIKMTLMERLGFNNEIIWENTENDSVVDDIVKKILKLKNDN